MVMSGFRRSLSLPKPNTAFEKSYHVRSTSLPCRSHPLISQLKDQLQTLKIWASDTDRDTSAWLCTGLNRLNTVHDSVDDLLQLPQTQETLRRRSEWIETLLEDFLRFADVYSIFDAALVSLKEEQLAAQVAIRRKRDESKLASYIKARKRMDKEMAKLVSVLRQIGTRFAMPVSVSESDAELASILREVTDVTVSVSVSLFCGVSSCSTSKSWMGFKQLSKKNKREYGIVEFRNVSVENLCRLKKRSDEEETRTVLRNMEALDECMDGLESGSERVFRSLINTRVSLLNILTQ